MRLPRNTTRVSAYSRHSANAPDGSAEPHSSVAPGPLGRRAKRDGQGAGGAGRMDRRPRADTAAASLAQPAVKTLREQVDPW